MWIRKIWEWIKQHPGEIIGTFIVEITVSVLLEAISELIHQGLPLWVRIPVPIFMASLTWYTITRLKSIESLVKNEEIRIDTNWDHAGSYVQQWIDDAKPEKADLLEYSSVTILSNVLKPLILNGSEIRLLLQNPEHAASQTQTKRICTHIESVLFVEPEISKYKKLRIKCYNQPETLIGRNLDNKLITLGWITYDKRPNELDILKEPRQIWGHNNPFITLTIGEKDFTTIKDFFNKVFTNLWHDQDSEYLNTICDKCKKKCNVKGSEWLRQVSLK